MACLRPSLLGALTCPFLVLFAGAGALGAAFPPRPFPAGGRAFFGAAFFFRPPPTRSCTNRVKSISFRFGFRFCLWFCLSFWLSFCF